MNVSFNHLNNAPQTRNVVPKSQEGTNKIDIYVV
jgi:hypothetical protein